MLEEKTINNLKTRLEREKNNLKLMESGALYVSRGVIKEQKALLKMLNELILGID
jgi:hypothetical protein